MTRWPQIILVNGASSAGKTTLCRALQDALEHPYLCIGFDDFISFTAPRYYRGADTPEQVATDDCTAQGVQMHSISDPGDPPSVSACFGPVFQRLIDSMAPAVRALVEGGNATIFDQVFHGHGMVASCQQAFAGLDVFTVGVSCPLDVLEARERSRGDRVIGRARGLVDCVHRFCDYDVWVDTAAADLTTCVATIKGELNITKPRRWST